MINHIRTLLLNHGRDGHGLTEPGEEYIPAEYIPRSLTPALKLIRSTLFGGNPDRLFLNYRMRQIMQLIHASELVADVYVDDPRVTYLPFNDAFFDGVFKATVVQTAGPPQRFDVAGAHGSNMSSGLSRQIWDIEVQDAGNVQVTKRLGVPETVVTTIIADAPLALPGSGLRIFLHGAAPGTQLYVESLARPEFDVAAVLNGTAATIGQYGIEEIFPSLAGEPVATWKRIWNEHPDAVMKFAAMLLAIAYRTARSPQQEGRNV